MNVLSPAERLIVAADFKPPAEVIAQGLARTRLWVLNEVLFLTNSLAGTGVCIKINSALRLCGYELITEIKARGLSAFADLKLDDISETLSTDGTLLALAEPAIVTVKASAGKDGMRKLKAQLPNTKVLGVGVLTTFSEEDSWHVHGRGIEAAMLSAANQSLGASIDGLIASPKELGLLQDSFSLRWPNMLIFTPGIRPLWAPVKGDDQKRTLTPAEAIRAGASGIVVGRPITGSDNPYDAAMRTIDEIASTL